jgi:hypothetical protein
MDDGRYMGEMTEKAKKRNREYFGYLRVSVLELQGKAMAFYGVGIVSWV